jgi:hypothetical protein
MNVRIFFDFATIIEYSGITILVRGRSFVIVPIVSKNILPFTIREYSSPLILHKIIGSKMIGEMQEKIYLT